MKNVHYAGDILTTGDALADAVLLYAQRLAASEGSATVTIPIFLDDGQIENATLLLGPASQVVAVHTTSEYPELINKEVTRQINRDARALGPAPAIRLESTPWSEEDLRSWEASNTEAWSEFDQ